MNAKQTLNLTVRGDFKVQAKKLAKLRRRSLSGLFEDLIEAEWKRVEDECKEVSAISNGKKSESSRKDHGHRKQIGFEESGGGVLAFLGFGQGAMA